MRIAKKIPYIPFHYQNTNIAVELAEYDSDTIIPEHAHDFQEFVLITSGACMHNFRGIDVPLITGDVFLIPSHMPHSYDMNSHIRIANCYFYPEKLGAKWDAMLKEIMEEEDTGHGNTSKSDRSNLQGIIHLDADEARQVEMLLSQILSEEENRQYGSEYVKAAILQIILVTIKRAKDRIPVSKAPKTNRKKRLIEDALREIDKNFREPLDVPALAKASCLSESYFRMLFKDVIGLTPLEYHTRVRIIKSLEYLRHENVTVAQAAEEVGIYDPNYFTRTFKKVMGHPPKYYRQNKA